MSAPQWTADIAIDLGLATALVRRAFPAFATATIVPFGIGWDNAAFLVDGRIVFRFPRRRVATRLMAREIAILPIVAAQVPLAIPVPSYVGAPSEAYPFAFAGYELVVGRTACAVALDDDARAGLAEPLAAFLRALHAIDPAPLVARGLPPDEIGRLDFAKRMKLVRERVPRLVSTDVVARTGVAAAAIERAVTWLDAHPPRPLAAGARVVVHGDLYARHVVLGDDGKPVAGIIDWGDIHLGDPALDLALAHLMLPERAHAEFRAAYGEIDAHAWGAARFRAIYSALLVLDYGAREDDVGMRTIGATALELMGISGLSV